MSLDFTVAHERYLPFVRLAVSSYPERYREDLMQEGLWGLYLGCCAYDPCRGVPFDAFVKVCVRNRIISAARRYTSEANLVSLGEVEKSFSDGSVPMEEQYAEHDAARELFRDLQLRLSLLEKKVLTLYLSGKTGRMIGDSLGISPKSVDNAMTRIKKKIREFLPD